MDKIKENTLGKEDVLNSIPDYQLKIKPIQESDNLIVKKIKQELEVSDFIFNQIMKGSK